MVSLTHGLKFPRTAFRLSTDSSAMDIPSLSMQRFAARQPYFGTDLLMRFTTLPRWDHHQTVQLSLSWEASPLQAASAAAFQTTLPG